MGERIFYAQQLNVNDKITFLCNGAGRGGHYRVFAKVTKVNRMTIAATEQPRSYRPGTLWRVHISQETDVTRET